MGLPLLTQLVVKHPTVICYIESTDLLSLENIEWACLRKMGMTKFFLLTYKVQYTTHTNKPDILLKV